MATDYGKILRKIRVDENELLKNMSDKLEVSSSFLSAVENGKKSPPENFTDKIREKYDLDEVVFSKLVMAEREYDFKQNRIDLNSFNGSGKEFMVSMARSFDKLDSQQLKQIQEMVKGGKK